MLHLPSTFSINDQNAIFWDVQNRQRESQEKYNKVRLMLPLMELSKQEEFVLFKSQVDKSKVAVQKALDETQLLFDSLMQEYFG